MRVLAQPRLETAKLIVDMGPETWSLYSVMRMLADENDLLSISIGMLTDLLHVTKQTVYNRLKKLTDYKIEGTPLVRIEEYGGLQGWNTYRVMWDIQGAITIQGVTMPSESNEVDSILIENPVSKLRAEVEKKNGVNLDGPLKTPKDVVAYWCQRYEAKYGKQYTVLNWAKEMSMAKRLLLKYGSVRAKAIIDAIIENYDVLWKAPKFPVPMLSMATSWLGKQAEAYAKEDADEEPTVNPEVADLIKRGLL